LSPHECQAEAERSAALALGKLLRELEQAISAAANGAKSALQDRVRALKAEQLAYEPRAKAAQAHRDAELALGRITDSEVAFECGATAEIGSSPPE